MFRWCEWNIKWQRLFAKGFPTQPDYLQNIEETSQQKNFVYCSRFKRNVNTRWDVEVFFLFFLLSRHWAWIRSLFLVWRWGFLMSLAFFPLSAASLLSFPKKKYNSSRFMLNLIYTLHPDASNWIKTETPHSLSLVVVLTKLHFQHFVQ